MATAAVTYTFSADEDAVASEVNVNFADVIGFINGSLVHLDGSKTMTGALVLPASDPVSGNQASRKTYVDAQVATRASTASVATAQAAADAAQADADAALALVPLGEVRWGRHDGTINGAGDTSFAHGLGTDPTSVVLTCTGSGSNIYNLELQNKDSVNINVRVYNSTTGATVTSGTVAFFWFAGE